MRRIVIVVASLALLAGVAVVGSSSESGSYSVTATAIEGCSCPLFCSCYYNAEPTGGHHCEFALVYRFDEGSHWGDVDLSGAKIWVSGDLGGHFGDGTTEWAVVTFDREVTPAQREAIGGWMGVVFPVEWSRVEMREDGISWNNGEKTAHAALESGMAEIQLDKVFDAHGEQAVVLNTQYWASDSNTGFHLAHATHHFDGDPSYAYERRNGFTITFTVAGEIPAAAAR